MKAMKITINQLKNIIKEEAKRVVREEIETEQYDVLYTVADVLDEAGALDVDVDEENMTVSFKPVKDEDEAIMFHDVVSVQMDKMGFEPEPGWPDVSIFTDETSGSSIRVDSSKGIVSLS